MPGLILVVLDVSACVLAGLKLDDLATIDLQYSQINGAPTQITGSPTLLHLSCLEDCKELGDDVTELELTWSVS